MRLAHFHVALPQEKFLKVVLRHYKLEKPTQVSKKLLLHARAKFYYRTGRLLQAWPPSQIKLMQSLANIEAKYAEDFLAAGAVNDLPPAIHDTPKMLLTKQGSTNKEEPQFSGSSMDTCAD